jgi:hypothetical protein
LPPHQVQCRESLPDAWRNISIRVSLDPCIINNVVQEDDDLGRITAKAVGMHQVRRARQEAEMRRHAACCTDRECLG